MNTDNQPTPDDAFRDAWQRAFDEAAETPPPRVWKAIERQLDANNRVRIVPLWTQARPWLTGVAATVAVVLVGWWAMRQRTGAPTTRPLSARATPSAVKTPVSTQNSDQLASNLATTMPCTRSGRSSEKHHFPRRMAGPVGPTPTSLLVAKAEPVTTRTEPAASTESGHEAAGISRLAAIRPTTAPGSRMEAAHPLTVNIVLTTGSDAFSKPALNSLTSPYDPLVTDGDEHSAVLIRKLSGKSFRTHPLTIQRVVWFRNDDPLINEPETSKPAPRETWASLSVMPSVFDPATAVRSVHNPAIASNAYSLATTSQTNSPMFSSQSGAAITVQAGAGRQLTDRWSVEAGVGYLQARSTVITPVQASVYAGAPPRTLYAAVLETTIGKNAASSPSAYDLGISQDKRYVIPLYSLGKPEPVRNDYAYVQVPVQVGYQLRPRRRLGLSLLGGLLTNWFVRNTVGETLVVKPSDGVFRSLTVSGTAGARFRYRSSRRWSASLAGVYQQSLQSGTLLDVNLTTRPRTVGVSVGVDYHF